jgi:hypothetical protein
MKYRRLALAIAAAGTVLGLTACSTYATPDTSSVGLAYTGGSWDSKAFQKCVKPGGNEAIDNGGDTAYYPVGTRTWAFGNGPGYDSGPIAVSTSNNQELLVSGLITFTLDTDCTEWTDGSGKAWPGGKIQKFHETIGRSKGAFFPEDSTQVPQGWRDALTLFLGGPANRVMDTAGGTVTWQNLYSDAGTVTSFTKTVTDELPVKIKDATGGDEFFDIISVQIDKPTVPDALRAQLEAQQTAILEQGTAAQKRDFQNSWPGGIPGYQAFQRQEAETACINRGQCTLIPAGSPVAVSSR